MNFLVAYESSDDEDKSNEKSTKISLTSTNINKNLETSAEPMREKSSIFKYIPSTKTEKLGAFGNTEMIVLPSQKELNLREKPIKGKIYVNIPKFENSDSEDEKNEKNEEPRIKKFKHGSSLLQYLPKAKVTIESTGKKSSMIPHSLMNKTTFDLNNNNKDSNSYGKKLTEIEDKNYNDDDDLLTNPAPTLSSKTPNTNLKIPLTNFFSTIIDDEDGKSIESKNSKTQASLYKYNYEKPTGSDIKNNITDDKAEYNEESEASSGGDQVLDSHSILNEEELLRLQGKQNSQNENLKNLNILDVNLQDHLGDYEKQRLKDATKEIDTTYYQSKNSGKQPDALAKRKHQMTYLAFQAKEREFELKNQWAENRFNKKQTQSKYGF